MLEHLKLIGADFWNIVPPVEDSWDTLRQKRKLWLEWATIELKKEAIVRQCLTTEEPFYLAEDMVLCMRGAQLDGTPVKMKIYHREDYELPVL